MDEKKSIEVTKEMIDAGFQVLKASGIADDYLGADRLLVAEIFAAMWDQLPAHQKESK